MNIVQTIRKTTRNYRDHGLGITVSKASRRLISFAYERRIYRIYRIHLDNHPVMHHDDKGFTFRLVQPEEHELVEQIEAMEEWIEGKVAEKLQSGSICLIAEEDYGICHRSLMEYRPGVFWGSTSALTGFARYVKDHEIDFAPYRPELIITWAAPVYEHEEALLREVFQCHVTNIYGAREVGHIACRCPEGSYHIDQEVLLGVGFQKDLVSEQTGTSKYLEPVPMFNVDRVAKSPLMAFYSTESEKCHFHFPHKSSI